MTRTLQTLEAFSCEGGTLVVACPPSTVISVQYAKYGRSVPSSRMCPRRAGRFLHTGELGGGTGGGEEGARVEENTNCLAVRSLEVRLEFVS